MCLSHPTTFVDIRMTMPERLSQFWCFDRPQTHHLWLYSFLKQLTTCSSFTSYLAKIRNPKWNGCPTNFMWILNLNVNKNYCFYVKMTEFPSFNFSLTTEQVLGYQMCYCAAGVCTYVFTYLHQKWILYQISFLLNKYVP